MDMLIFWTSPNAFLIDKLGVLSTWTEVSSLNIVLVKRVFIYPKLSLENNCSIINLSCLLSRSMYLLVESSLRCALESFEIFKSFVTDQIIVLYVLFIFLFENLNPVLKFLKKA